MSHARYFVLRLGSRWHVTLEGQTMGHYASRTESIEAATIMANLMGSMHHDADVMVEMGPGQPLELVWTFGQDAPPTRARKSPKAAKAAMPDNSEVQPHVRLVQRGGAAA